MKEKKLLEVLIYTDIETVTSDVEVGDLDFAIPGRFYDYAKNPENRRKIADFLLNASIQIRNNQEPFKDLPEFDPNP